MCVSHFSFLWLLFLLDFNQRNQNKTKNRLSNHFHGPIKVQAPSPPACSSQRQQQQQQRQILITVISNMFRRQFHPFYQNRMKQMTWCSPVKWAMKRWRKRSPENCSKRKKTMWNFCRRCASGKWHDLFIVVCSNCLPCRTAFGIVYLCIDRLFGGINYFSTV